MSWDQSQHPRQPNGQFGTGGGGASTRKSSSKSAGGGQAPDKAARAQAKAKLSAARAAAKTRATQIVASAKVKAAQIKWKSNQDVAKKLAAINAGKVADPKAAKAAISTAKKAASAKAKQIVDSARARAKAQTAAIIAKAQAAGPKAPTKVSPTSAKPPDAAARPLTDHDLKAARDRVMATATSRELEVALTYSGHTYEQTNSSLRSGSPKKGALGGLSEGELRESVTHLDSLLSKAKITEPVLTYRGSAPHPAFDNLKPGQVFVDKAFVSTTADKNVVFKGSGDEETTGFHGGVLFHITSPAGTKIAGIPSKYPGEKEMLLGRGTAFRLDREERATESNGRSYRVLHVTVVGQAAEHSAAW